mmetsp:Transcript_19884/g.56170  ORF Transcript_19884/g.56170 Transcript_19884/m.56170 type:complete len:282 (+) Transcript_19884:141-986(+)
MGAPRTRARPGPARGSCRSQGGRGRQQEQARGQTLEEPCVDVGEQVQKEDDQVELVHVGQENQTHDAGDAEVGKEPVLLRPLGPQRQARDDVVGHGVHEADAEDDPQDRLRRLRLYPHGVHRRELHDGGAVPHVHHVDHVVQHLQHELQEQQADEDLLVPAVEEVDLPVHAHRGGVGVRVAVVGLPLAEERPALLALQPRVLVARGHRLRDRAVGILQEDRPRRYCDTAADRQPHILWCLHRAVAGHAGDERRVEMKGGGWRSRGCTGGAQAHTPKRCATT